MVQKHTSSPGVSVQRSLINAARTWTATQTWAAAQRFNNDVLLSFGTTNGTDADLYYDGTNLLLNVNSGGLILTGAFTGGTVAGTTGTFSGILQVNGRGGVRAIEVPLNDFVADQGSPAYGNASSVVAWAFDAAADERIQASFTVPEDFVSGGGIRVFYIMASATSGAVEIEANITAAAEGENFDAVTGQVTVVDTVPGTAGLLATFTNTTGTYAANDRVNILLKRDADGGSDNATGDMYLVGVQFVYVSDS